MDNDVRKAFYDELIKIASRTAPSGWALRKIKSLGIEGKGLGSQAGSGPKTIGAKGSEYSHKLEQMRTNPEAFKANVPLAEGARGEVAGRTFVDPITQIGAHRRFLRESNVPQTGSGGRKLLDALRGNRRGLPNPRVSNA